MSKATKPQPKTNTFFAFLKRRPKTSIAFVLILVLAIGFGISQEIEQQTQAHKLRVADEKIQQFADEIEAADQSIKFERKKQCRHLVEKLGKGALICETTILVEGQYKTQGELLAKASGLVGAVSQQSVLQDLTIAPSQNKNNPSDWDSHSVLSSENNSQISASLNYFDFSDERPKLRGQFKFYVHASEKVHRPIYQYIE